MSPCLPARSVSRREPRALSRGGGWRGSGAAAAGRWGAGGRSGTSLPGHLLLPPTVLSLSQGDLVAVGVLSGNRNFEGRVHPNTRANYLASPPLVIAYAIAGTIKIDFEKEPLGKVLFVWPVSSQ